MSVTRSELRETLAKKCKRYTYAELGSFGISRVSDITGLDSIGLPVFTSTRPSGTTLSISSGKSVSSDMARAGAILEATELQSAENPTGDWDECSISLSSQRFSRVIDQKLFQVARDSVPLLHPGCTIAFEPVDDIVRSQPVWLPSDMIWFKQRFKTPFMLFHATSNGLAAGFNRRDAELAGLYECVERDAWAVSEHIKEVSGRFPDRVALNGHDFPDDIACILDALATGQVYPFVFDLTLIGIPVFAAYLVDPRAGSPGLFSGFGCSLDSGTAIARALMEATQARVAYIAGARDDLFRRRFLLLKNIDHHKALETYNSIRPLRNWDDFCALKFSTVDAEFSELCDRLETFGISEIYSKELYSNADFTVVKVVTPQLDTPVWEHCSVGKRSLQACGC